MRRPQSGAVEAVLSNEDLVAQILRGNIGPSAFAAASRVCKSWHSVCRSDESVLRSAALYQGAVTKTVLCGLLAVAPREAAVLPHTVHRRRNGGQYQLFGEPAIDAAIADGGMPALRDRLAKRAAAIAWGRCFLNGLSVWNGRSALEQARLEDAMHARVVNVNSKLVPPNLVW
jgi:hypothetical protein